MADQTIPTIKTLRGNVGIGTASPCYKLEIDGGDFLVNTASGYVQIDDSDNSLKLSDNVRLKIGTGNDLQLGHDGNDSRIEDLGTGDLVIQGSNDIWIMSGSDTAINTNDDGAVVLYYDSSAKFETTSSGATITGGLTTTAISTIGGSLDIEGELNLTTNGNKNFDVYTLANSNYFRIRHHNPSGNLFETAAVFTANAGAELYYDHAKKFETTSAGATVTGSLTVSSDLIINGTTTTIDTTNLLVEDKNIVIGNVDTPSDTTADGGGITLKGASDYTINWTNSLDSWVFNQGITVGVDDTGHDVKFFGATSGKYMLWDESDDILKFPDSTEINLGTGGDLRIYHDGTNNYIKSQNSADLYIHQGANDKDIIFECDDGSGGVETYFYLD